MNRLIETACIMLAAFFELCLTGRSDYAWRIAYSDSNYRKRASCICPPPSFCKLALDFLTVRRSVIAIVVTFTLAVFFSALGVLADRRSTSTGLVSPHQVVLEDESQWMDEFAAEPPSSFYIGRAEQIAVECCVIASVIMIVGGILINAKRKESRYGQRERGIS